MVAWDNEQYKVDEEELEENGEIFNSVLTTLTWLHLDTTQQNFSVECRSLEMQLFISIFFLESQLSCWRYQVPH